MLEETARKRLHSSCIRSFVTLAEAQLANLMNCGHEVLASAGMDPVVTLSSPITRVLPGLLPWAPVCLRFGRSQKLGTWTFGSLHTVSR